MNLPMRFAGLPVSEGIALGTLHIADTETAVSATPEEVRDAFAAVAAERFALAERLRDAGRDEEAAIIEVGGLIAADPLLGDPAVAAVRDGGDVATAVRQATEAQAAVLEALAIPEMAERAGDVRQVALAVLDHLSQAGAAPRPAGDFILVRREVSPADLIELTEAGLVGAVSVAGGASSHAAIIARGLGVPMIAGTDPAVLAAPAGQRGLLDADAGELIVGPEEGDLPAALAGRDLSQRQTGPGAPAGSVGLAGVTGAARTADGREVTVLCNVASAAETRLGLAAGAAGVGLLRTEIPYPEALAWPTLAEHQAQLAPILGLLAGRPATVRLLDFSGDKIPPFLAGTQGGLDALLGQPEALADQLRAALASGRDTELKIMVPMVARLDQLAQVRAALADAVPAGAAVPPLGMMVEVAATAEAAAVFAPAAGFFSIGTNDLTSEVLGLSRADPRMGPALAADPRVLALISRVVAAAATSGIEVSVCGDAAADPGVLPLLIGLGVRTFSVGAARLPRVAEWVAAADTASCADLAAEAMSASAGPPAAHQLRADAGPS